VKVGIIQSNYIPWKGYFDFINSVDIFVLYDDVQYTRRDWRNRNLIKSPNGLIWLTIPVIDNYAQTLIKDVKIADNRWNERHWKTIRQFYSKAKYFSYYKDLLESTYLTCREEFLSEVNYKFLKLVCDILNIKTKIIFSVDLNVPSELRKTERLLFILKKLGATHYLSGPAAKSYLDVELLNKEGIQVEWMDYSGYPEYPQLWPPFVHEVSIIDLIFNTGPEAPKYMKSFKITRGD